MPRLPRPGCWPIALEPCEQPWITGQCGQPGGSPKDEDIVLHQAYGSPHGRGCVPPRGTMVPPLHVQRELRTQRATRQRDLTPQSPCWPPAL